MQQNQKKRILFVITKSNYGGAQRYVHELATGLPRDEYTVAVACGGNGPLVTKLHEAGITVCEVPSFQRDISIGKEFKSLFELGRIIRTFNPDIVHLNSSKAGGTGALVARILGVPKIIFTAHGWAFWEDRSLLWRSLVWLFSWITALLAHTIIVVSRFEYDRTPLPFLRKKLVYIPTALPHITFIEREDARKKLYSESILTKHIRDHWLVATSEHNHNKNLLCAIRAVATFNQTHAKKIFFTLMSDGDERQLLERYVTEHNLDDTIAFTGYVPDARTYLKAFDIFILPSLKEGMPYGLLEAGQAGLACIASNVGGIPEVIESGRTGILIDPRNDASVVAALEFFTEDTPRDLPPSYLYGTELEKKVSAEYTLDRMITTTKAVYM